MAASRYSGIVFEAHVAFVCAISRIKYDSKDEKFRSLLRNAPERFSVHLVFLINKAMRLLEKHHGTLRRCRTFLDNDGRHSESGDFQLTFQDGTQLSLSLKRNNHDIKAPRPSALATQMGLDTSIADAYKEAYKTLTKKFYDAWHSVKVFRKVEAESLRQFLHDTNALAANLIRRHGNGSYLQFLLGKSNTVLFEWNGKNDLRSSLVVYFMKPMNTSSLNRVRVIRCEQQGNYIYVTFSTGHRIQMRLHTASESIQPAVSLKWAVQLHNRNEIFPRYTFDSISYSFSYPSVCKAMDTLVLNKLNDYIP